jgi:hypothetical protein
VYDKGTRLLSFHDGRPVIWARLIGKDAVGLLPPPLNHICCNKLGAGSKMDLLLSVIM